VQPGTLLRLHDDASLFIHLSVLLLADFADTI
jgi:hypothetical protein